MTSKYIQPGEIIDYTASADIVSNQVVVAGALLGVAVADIASGDTGSMAIEGVFALPKAAGAAMALGAKPYWDVSVGNFAGSGAAATGDIVGGAIVARPALAADTEVWVKLCPGMGVVTA